MTAADASSAAHNGVLITQISKKDKKKQKPKTKQTVNRIIPPPARPVPLRHAHPSRSVADVINALLRPLLLVLPIEEHLYNYFFDFMTSHFINYFLRSLC